LILRVGDLVRATAGDLISGSPNQTFERVSTDTRALQRGDAFFALQGPRFDAHDYLAQAADHGATVLVVQALDGRATFDVDRRPALVRVDDTLKALQRFARWMRDQSTASIVGITGSNGKTTTKEMLAAILRGVNPTLATRGNLNNHIGLPLTLTELRPEHRFAVIEMGTSKKGDMELLMELTRPQVGLITNVGKDHLEFLETPEGVLDVNRGVFDGLPAEGTAIINLDDPLLAPFADFLSCRRLTYGLALGADVSAENVEPTTLPLRFTLRLGDERYPAQLSGPGTVQVLNAIAAAAAAHALGVPPSKIVDGLAHFTPAAMRMEVRERPDGSVLINDAYNANPSSMRASISSFCESYASRPRWIVLGDMRELGAAARREHRELGEWLCKQGIDRVFLYGRDTRFIAEGLRASGAAPTVERFGKKRYLIAALQDALPAARPAVLFKASRSLRLEQVVAPLLSSNGRPSAR
jgi:UDP-N-acetylmuramoyl-tripeptide--D-alanyl-D-alanine ligase